MPDELKLLAARMRNLADDIELTVGHLSDGQETLVRALLWEADYLDPDRGQGEGHAEDR